ncbi:hypothetical protein FEF65_07130 [Mariprofundus erugo]|uniref:Uncharacterized protein n=1 Tax=Mariprofundus erugo TaxID=2528639 RepID=A0A5R9GNH5_9PROT|nr:hypothetical protein [Mariprofundus erugo]TLS67208.1 hypothetical protein FEF65_07130 [Mariprofundus erugo]
MGYASSIIVGFGDGVSGGYTATLRRAFGTNGYVNQNAAAYQAALVVGTAWQIGLTGAFGAANTFASFTANIWEGDANNAVVDSITYGTARSMSGFPMVKNPSNSLQVFGNVFGYVFGQTASSTAPTAYP